MKNVGLKLTISLLASLSIMTTTVAIEQTIVARNAHIILERVLAAQAAQPAMTLGWDI